MPSNRSGSTQRRKIRRRTFTERLLGMGPDSSVTALKEYLHAARITPSPDTRLDLVMVEDIGHFEDLIAIEGVPLAREDIDAELLPAQVTLHVRPSWFAGIAVMACAFALDDILSWCSVQFLPW